MIENLITTLNEIKELSELISQKRYNVNQQLNKNFQRVSLNKVNLTCDYVDYPILKEGHLATLVNKTFRQYKINTSYPIKVNINNKSATKVSVSDLLYTYWYCVPITKVKFLQKHNSKLVPDLFSKTIDFMNAIHKYTESLTCSVVHEDCNIYYVNKEKININYQQDKRWSLCSNYLLKSDANKLIALVNKYNDHVRLTFKTMLLDPILNTHAGQIIFRKL